jgi:hypothetical protein
MGKMKQQNFGNQILLGLGVFALLLGSAYADGTAEFASPWVVDFTDYNSSQIVTHTAKFLNNQAKFVAPGPSPLFNYCSTKYHDKTYTCVGRVTTGAWAIDPSVFTNKRAWAATSRFHYTTEGCGRITISYNPGSTPTSSNDTWAPGSGNVAPVHAQDNCAGSLDSWNINAASAQGFFCPLGAKFRSISGVYTNPYDACSQYDPFSRCPAYWEDSTHHECSDYSLGCTYLPHGACSDSDFNSYVAQYNSCITPITQNNIDNQGVGYDDCFCTHESNGVRDYGFQFANGVWKCLQCAEGMKQRDSTGVGCVSRCAVNQAWVNGGCQACPSGQEAFNAKCVAVCNSALGQVRDLDSGVCKSVCPSGMAATQSGADANGKPLYSCGCNDTRFEAGSYRVPALPTGIAGMTSPAWIYSAALSPNNTDAGCACGDAAKNASLYDQTYAIAAALPTGIPYGLVPMNSTNPGKFVCGCPNYNEKYVLDSTLGHFRCVPQISGVGVGLLAVSNPADLPGSGVFAAKSDSISQARALLRGAGDMTDNYTRRVWKCRPGFYLNGTSCDVINDAVADKFACTDDASQVVPSSVLNTAVGAALAPGGALAGTPFAKLTNKRIACCAQNSAIAASVTKPACVESVLGGFPGGFDGYYDVAGGDNAASKIDHPNRIYLLDAGGRIVTGLFRSSDGTRCNLSGVNGPSAEMDIFSTIAARAKVDPDHALDSPATIAAFGGKADQRCNQLVRAALEATCKLDQFDADGNANWIMISGQKRCVGSPASLVVHYDIIDLRNPGQLRRAQFRTLSSENPGTLANPIDMKALLSQ